MRWKRAAGWAAAALLVVAVLWFGGVGFWASLRLAEADREWTAAFGSLEEFQKKYPKAETNASARRLEELAKAAGYDLQAKTASASGAVGEPRRESPVGRPGWPSRNGAKPSYNVPIRRWNPPPAGSSGLSSGTRDELAALEESLLAGPRPEWAFDVNHPEAGRDSRGWWNYMQLQKALIGRALLAAFGDATRRGCKDSRGVVDP